MRSVQPPVHAIPVRSEVLILAALALAVLIPPAPGYGEEPGAVTPIEPDHPGLLLLTDATRVIGWVADSADLAGHEVTVRCDGKTEILKLSGGNTFAWPYRVEKPVEARFSVAGRGKTVLLQPPAKLEPAIFFVVDRPVFRPDQTLSYAAFLRVLNAKGQWTPVAGREVKVSLLSENKKTLVHEATVHTDENGMLTGEYRFSKADPLDRYVLSCEGCKGRALVTLAEFRKSKIKLNIEGTVENDNLKLRLVGVDFLGKPIGGGSVDFTVSVVENAPDARTAEKERLKAEDFAYYEPLPLALADREALSEEQVLLCEAYPAYRRFVAQHGAKVLMQDQRREKLGADGAAEYTLPLAQEWRTARHAVRVEGVLVDENGREQRASQWVRMSDTPRPTRLTLPRRSYLSGEEAVVRMDGAGEGDAKPATLVAFRLVPQLTSGLGGLVDLDSQLNQVSIWNHGRMGNRYRYSSSRLFLNSFSGDWRYGYGMGIPQSAPVKRELVTAVPFQGLEAKLTFKDSGAYLLVATTPNADGSSLQHELGCVVHPASQPPALELKLDRTHLEVGEKVTGRTVSRSANGRFLLVLRDGNGIRSWKTVENGTGEMRIEEQLPKGLTYGVSFELHAKEKDGGFTHKQALLHVRPGDRMLTVKTETEETYGPGEKVKLKLKVNRNEPVDLLVSVYDQSALGFARSQPVDARDFFLADERVRRTAGLDLLRAKLAGVTLESIVEDIRATLGDKARPEPDQVPSPEQQLISSYDGNYLHLYTLQTALEAAGVETMQSGPGWYGGNWHTNLDKKPGQTHSLLDLMAREQNNWKLVWHYSDGILQVAEYHPEYAQQAGQWAMWQNQAGFLGNFRGRGDSHWNYMASANSMYSASGQSHLSMMPAMPMGFAPPAMLDLDGGDSGIYLRRDFSDSAFWNARVRTGGNGEAKVEFKLPDSLTNWQVAVTAISRDMRVGRHTATFRTSKPVMVWPMLPQGFTQGDAIRVYASVHNRTDREQEIRVKIKVQDGTVTGPAEVTVRVPANANRPVYWTFTPGETEFAQLLMVADCEAGSDASLKRLPVFPCSAEQARTWAGVGAKTIEVDVPADVDLKHARLEVSLSPSLLADITDTLDYLVGYPHGCVEQTMSRFLPCIKVDQVLKRHGVRHPGLQAKLPEYVEAGVKRLLELQQPDGGWGWNGNGQTHEMMTPYALYGLLEAERAGYTIPNEKAVQNGLARLKQFIEALGHRQQNLCDWIYCMYVYAHRHKLEDEWWASVDKQLDKLSDYALALSLELAVKEGKPGLAKKLADRLKKRVHREDDGVYWTTANFSRWGNDRFEITGAALKALVAYDAQDPYVDDVITWLAANKRGNRWNSTKDTAIIVYAVCDYLNARQGGPAVKDLAANVSFNDGAKREMAFDKGFTAETEFNGGTLRHGRNHLVIKGGPEGMLHRVVLRWRRQGQDIAALDQGVEVTRTFYVLNENGGRQLLKAGAAVPRGAYLECEVQARARNIREMRYVLVESPRPSGCEVLPENDRRFRRGSTQYVLREDKAGAVFFHHEQTGNGLFDRCVFHADMSGQFVVPPASVELMYDPQKRGHSGAFHFTVEE